MLNGAAFLVLSVYRVRVAYQGAVMTDEKRKRQRTSTIDQDHTQILKLVSVLPQANHDDIRKIFKILIEYLTDHFKHEEAFMRRVNYPNVDKHVAEHFAIQEFCVEKLPTALKGPAGNEAVLSICAKIQEHVLFSDETFVNYLVENGITLPG